MPNTRWITESLDSTPKNEVEKNELISFFTKFYTNIVSDTGISEQEEEFRQDLELEELIKEFEEGQSKSLQYKESVFNILKKTKARLPLTKDQLENIQGKIEDLTIKFDEESIFKSAPKILINTNELSAKDYLKDKVLSKEDSELLSEFGHYTIEALIVHVLSILFSSTGEYSPVIRVTSLVERLESSVRTQAILFRSRRCNKTFYQVLDEHKKVCGKERNKISKLEKNYPFGTFLVEFMDSRKLITLTEDLQGSILVNNKKKGSSYYLPKHLYANCNFDISLLPIKLNLPMICKPLDWKSANQLDEKPRNLFDLSGGYLSEPTGEIYDRYRLLSTGNLNNFYIDFGKDDSYNNLCSVMNKLQSQAFQINRAWLKYLLINYKNMIKNGLLMPKFLASMNPKDGNILLRKFYLSDEVIKSKYNLSILIHILCKNIQRARYEQFIIKLAIAYEGYHFYLPAFLDFRGRIYRSGVLHFHERDLARSMIVFANREDMEKNMDLLNSSLIVFTTSIAFHYQSFVSAEDAQMWFYENINDNFNLIELARGAKHPFQFLANLNSLYQEDCAMLMPITQDASASAYQIMSYFLLDEKMAERTNLIPSSDEKIQDVYSFILEELKEFMKGSGKDVHKECSVQSLG